MTETGEAMLKTLEAEVASLRKRGKTPTALRFGVGAARYMLDLQLKGLLPKALDDLVAYEDPSLGDMDYRVDTDPDVVKKLAVRVEDEDWLNRVKAVMGSAQQAGRLVEEVRINPKNFPDATLFGSKLTVTTEVPEDGLELIMPDEEEKGCVCRACRAERAGDTGRVRSLQNRYDQLSERLPQANFEESRPIIREMHEITEEIAKILGEN